MYFLITMLMGAGAGLYAQLLDHEMKVTVGSVMAKVGSAEAFQAQPLLFQANTALLSILSCLILLKVCEHIGS